MRIAVLADIHGNLPALEAVLAQLDPPAVAQGGEVVDAIVVCGDITSGPLVAECLELIRTRPEPVHWVRGNGERETVRAFDGELTLEQPSERAAAWSAATLDRATRDELHSWPIALSLDGVCFCHGSPRSEDEVITRATPEAVLGEVLRGVVEPLVVGGHTHQQMVRARTGSDPPRADYANAGSVGRPYEGDAAAFWMIVADGAPELRRTGYDVPAAIVRLRASGFPEIEDHLEGSLTERLDPDWATRFFEYGAGRGSPPGEPRLAD